MKIPPLCFVLMPFGKKSDSSNRPDIDFDNIYKEAIKPAIIQAGMKPLRADSKIVGGIIHKTMFERLLLCDYAVADLTGANANVFYELGVRHAVRPRTTVTIFSQHQTLPFDVNFLSSLQYHLSSSNRLTKQAKVDLRTRLADRLQDFRNSAHDSLLSDSPVFQLLHDLHPPKIDHLKSELFRERADYSESIKDKLAHARELQDRAAIVQIANDLGPMDAVESGVLIDIFLSFRAIEDWHGMVDFFTNTPDHIKRPPVMNQQYAFALNRMGQHRKALKVLQNIESRFEPGPETLGLTGRVYKDMWQKALKSGKIKKASGLLSQAIAAYVRGFEADWRDPYPGVNAVTLLEVQGSRESLNHKDELLPVVMFSVKQRLKATENTDYWDLATLMELAVLDNDEIEAKRCLPLTLAAVREPWEPKTTARNLQLIQDARRERNTATPWLSQLIEELQSD